jgi:addiction module HigA family antidote
MTVQETRDQLRSDQLDNIHPGEVLRKEFLEPLGITPYRLAKSIGVAQTRVGEIMEGKRSISTDTAIRLGRFFNVTPQFWLGLQQAYDIEREQSNPIYDEIRPCESLPDAAA